MFIHYNIHIAPSSKSSKGYGNFFIFLKIFPHTKKAAPERDSIYNELLLKFLDQLVNIHSIQLRLSVRIKFLDHALPDTVGIHSGTTFVRLHPDRLILDNNRKIILQQLLIFF